MRRTVLVSVAVVIALVMASGPALAETITCDDTPPCYGTPERDDITGTATGDQTIYALGGNDRVIAGADGDTVYGAAGIDNLMSLDGDDTVFGGSDGDRIEVGGGSDTAYGGRGSDEFLLGIGDSAGTTDRGYGGGGNDTIEANDGNVDVIDCGKGTDRVYYDVGTDTIKNCEIKNP